MAQTLNDVTDAYSRVSVALIDEAEAIARGSFTNLGSWRDEDIPKFVNLVSPSLTGLKRKASSASIAYMGQIAAINGKKFVAPSLDDIDISTAELRGGVNVDDVYRRPFVQMRMALAKNPTDVAAAIRTGSVAAGSLARTEVQLARRKASLVARKNNGNIVGYIRTLTGLESCALCYVASTQRYRKGDLLPIHPGCDCGEMPIYGSQDPGQVIDEFRLGKSHEAIKDRFGFAIAQARGEIDYRKVMIEDHGELGPLLTVKGHKFTGPNDLSLKGKKMPETAPRPVTDASKAIVAKAKTIDGVKIAEDINSEFKTLENIARYRGKAVIVGGPKAKKYLEDVLDLGKTVDDEINLRAGKRISELSDNDALKVLQPKVDAAKALRTQVLAERNAFVESLAAKQKAEALAKNPRTSKRELAFIERTAVYDAQRQPEWLGIRKRFDEADSDYQRLLRELERTGPSELERARIRSEEIQKLLAETRAVGQDVKFEFKNATANAKLANEHISTALDAYPADWVAKAAEKYSGKLDTGIVSRGYFARYGELKLSGTKEQPGFGVSMTNTAYHEVGHMMEETVPGLKALEWAYFHERAAGDYKRWGTKREGGIVDKFADIYKDGKPYQGRAYAASNLDLSPNSPFEIFTTGIESTFGNSRYFNYSNGTQDEETRQFILGALFGL